MNAQKITSDDIAKFTDMEYWRELFPDLTITEYPFKRCWTKLNTDLPDSDASVAQMKKEGYINLDSVLPADKMEQMADIITTLVDKGIPPVLCFVYDEFWQLYKDIAPVMSPIIGEDYMISLNRWAWHIPADDSYSGFRPHRDMPPKLATVIRDDGLPMITTAWIPLKEVHPSHACIYVLPQNRDPNLPDNFMKFNVPPDHLQDIKALPGKAGSIMSWNPKVLHWGGRGDSFKEEPRISIGSYLMRTEGAELTGVKTNPSFPVTFDFRLGAIAETLGVYTNSVLTDESYSAEILERFRGHVGCAPGEWRFEHNNK